MGRGGIEAEAAMLGQPVSMLIPDEWALNLPVNYVKVLPPQTWFHCYPNAAQTWRGGEIRRILCDGLDSLPLADRATIANMSPDMVPPVASSQSML